MKTRLLLAAALTLLGAATQAQELLTNGDFAKDSGGWNFNGAPDTNVEYTSTGGHANGCLHFTSTSSEAQAIRIARQEVKNYKPGTTLKVTAWIKGKGAGLGAVVLQGWDKDYTKITSFGSTQQSSPLHGDFDWTKVEASLAPSDDTVHASVLLFLAGKGEVWIDDVSLTVAGEGDLDPKRLDGPGLFEAKGAFNYTATQSVGETKILIPIMLAYREQVPLNYHFTATPQEKVKATRVYEDKPGNYVAEVTLAPMKANESVAIEWKSLGLAGERSFKSVPANAPIPTKWPEEVKPWLNSTTSVQSADPKIQKVAREIRGGEKDVLKIIAATLARTTQIYAQQQGRCTSLDAVQALEKQGSCTSNANLVAALLRANNIPARILAGYPLWSGPLQTHYIVEAYVPDYGWYPIESTMLRERWEPYMQVQVSIVPPEYENKSGTRPGGFAGVPYLSLTEFGEGGQPVFTIGKLDKENACDHQATKIRVLPGEPEKWQQALQIARQKWTDWLKSNPSNLDMGRDLSTAKTLDEVIAGLGS